MTIHDRHCRLTAEALKAGWTEVSNDPAGHSGYTLRWEGQRQRYRVRYWSSELSVDESYYYDRLDRARHAAACLCAGKKPRYPEDL